MKRCRTCKRKKSTEAFSKNKNTADGLQSECKQCVKDYYDNYYVDNKAEILEKRRAYRLSLLAPLRALKEVPCSDCGVEYPYYVMDFDHRTDEAKLCNIGETSGKCTRKLVEAALKEAKKCDPVCANCHRERTHQRLVDART